ncbi:MAG: acetoin utilization protein AcuC [Candidatus Nitrosothermus koennekii]|nr:MAG: acetoin utilization protein AcuC [Candidatus Nitrosothermus koennekii]
MHKVAVFYGKQLANYGFDPPHPFGRDRLDAFWRYFVSKGYDKLVKIEEPIMASDELILQFHDKEYLEFVKKASSLGYGYLDYGDTPAYKGVYEASAYVVGTSLKALDLAVNGYHTFNPIGGLHHARRDRAGGFCVFNDIGVLIESARNAYNIKRIAYVDIDAHHGDGVFYEYVGDKDVIIADIHEDPNYLYPGTGFEYEEGEGEAKGTKMNICMKPNADEEEFIKAFDKAKEFIDNSKPELIIFQCGADCLKGDPITHLAYTEKAHYYASKELHKLAHKHNAKIIALGGGGYNRNNIARAWLEVVKGLLYI